MIRSFTLLLLTLSLSAQATPRPIDRIAPGVKIARALRHVSPLPFRPQIIDGDLFIGSIRFLRPPDEARLEVFELLGVEFLRSQGRRQDLGGIYPARVPFGLIDWLSVQEDLVQVSTDFLLPPIAPLDTTRPLTGAGTFSPFLEGILGEQPGEGMVIADFDHGIDPFHPGLFRADGGYFAWTDVNMNGALEPGTDGVDLDQDGIITPGEILQASDASMWNAYAEPSLVNKDGVYQVGLDWLFLDPNGSGKREWGAGAGAMEDTAAYGEPVFVVDDVDQDGVVDPEEKLVLLRTSKIKAVKVGDAEFHRGANLSTLDPDMFEGTWGYDQSGHGTGVTGILVANTPGLGRFVGMAPAADVVLVDSSTDSGGAYGYLEKLIWAKDQGAHLFLHEYSSWGSDHMDGSSNYDQALDSLALEDGIPQVCPAGNLAEADKHSLNDAAMGTTEIRFSLPTEYPDYPGYPFEVPYLYVTLYFQGDKDDVDLSFSIPGGAPILLPEDPWEPQELAAGVFGGVWTGQSPGGFAMLTMVVMSDDQISPLPSGTWTLHLDNAGDQALAVHGFLNDPLTGWNKGPYWIDGLSHDTTLCMPSTATEGLTVAAFAGVHDNEEGQGNLRGYSSRGPRMDGAIKVGLTAPDDPYTTMPTMKLPYSNTLLHGGYTVFGGTSGAGPHVAGTLALLMQAADGLSGQAAVQAMYDGALQTPEMGALPNKDWGWGKLDVHTAALGAPPTPNDPPVAMGTAQDTWALQVVLDGVTSTDPDGDPMTYRWDSDYDGIWDTPQSDNPQAVIQLDEPTAGIAKLRVYDDKGMFSDVLVLWEGTDTPPMPEPAEDVLEPPEDALQADGITPADQIGGGGGGSDVGSGAGGCDVGGGAAPLAWLLLLLAALALRSATSRIRSH